MMILQTPLFARQLKKLSSKNKLCIEDAVKKILQDPLRGEQKKGDLRDVKVYKFRLKDSLCLLAYTVGAQKICLIALGNHENFYRDLKGYL
ncbi:MAG: type II toxin-antitoxin system RelE/ParE family toxin [Alphaproteobacteria bacterium]|nr:type II toxin-antitoxin system RelE/ParE family toxin [Alphaproteobacteria bacterium]